jgi:hypothetical protein
MNALTRTSLPDPPAGQAPGLRPTNRAACRGAPQPFPELLAAIRDARVAVAVARTGSHASARSPSVEQQDLFRALFAYTQSLTALGLPVPHTIRSELHIYQDLVMPPER